MFGAASLAVACFSDSPPAGSGPGGTDGTGGTSGVPVCPAGSGGCPCYGNETCDPGFSCDVPLQICVSETCVDGQVGCLCDAGMCERGLVCEAGLCAQEPAGDTTQGPPTSSTSAATSAGADATMGDPDTSTGDSTTGSVASTGDQNGVCFPEGIYGGCADNVECECVQGLDAYSVCTQACTSNEECGDAKDFPGADPGCYSVSVISTEMVCALRCDSNGDCPCGLSCVDSGVPSISVCAVPDF